MRSQNRREFLKSCAAFVASYSLLGFRSTLLAQGYDEKYKASPNFYNGKFNNLIKTHEGRKPGTFFEMVGQIIFGKEKREPDFELPVNELNPSFFTSSPATGLRAIWMGHSTVLVEIDGYRILIDPVWSDRVGPIFGPKRLHKPPIQISSLPKLDAVLISHEHYDHLDEASIRALSKTNTKFYMPLGIGEHLKEWGVSSEHIIELDWWDQAKLGDNDFTILATPARHYPGRWFSSIPTLWTSWTLLGPHHRVFFSGDTGVLPTFETIGEKYGPFDLTMIEIGAYHKNLEDIHLGPKRAIDVHKSLMGKVFLPIHWGTFNLGIHAWNDPIEEMIKIATNRSVDFITPMPGQPVTIDKPIKLKNWWLRPAEKNDE